MRVLMVHNYYRYSGGEDMVYEAEVDLLRSYGHEVLCEEYRNSNISDDRSLVDTLQLAAGSLWSQSSHRRFAKVIDEFRPDVAHFHNTFPLVSPSAYYACQQAGVPVVQTLHNFRIACPSATLFRDGQICTDCLNRRFAWPGILHGCYRESRSQTLAVGAMQTFHRALGTWSRKVDRFIALSQHSKRLYVEAGIPSDMIAIKPNFVEPDEGPGTHPGGFALFVGRLGIGKGVETLIEAWSHLSTDVELRIVGDGPLASVVEHAVQADPRIQWLGQRAPAEVAELLGQAAFLIFPSEGFETFGRTIIEAFARGTPVLASRLGAPEEIVQSGVNGLQFSPRDPADLASAVDRCSSDSELRRRLEVGARRSFEEHYTAEQNYHTLCDIYRSVLSNRAYTGKG